MEFPLKKGVQLSSDKLATERKTVKSVELPLGLFLSYHSFTQHLSAYQAHSQDRAVNKKIASLSPGAYIQLGILKLNIKLYN